GGPQGCRPVVLAADHGAHRQPAVEEQAGDSAPDRPDLTGGPSDEDQCVLGHATALLFAESLMHKPLCPAHVVGVAFSGSVAPCVVFGNRNAPPGALS